jgi:hypothetical protein
MDLKNLQQRLEKETVSDIVNSLLLSGSHVCYQNDPSLILALKKEISKRYSIHVKEIEIVGSAKIGFSLSNERFGKPFCETSDIDLAVISSQLFDNAWLNLLRMDMIYYKLPDADREKLKECYETIHRGFISPERLPYKSNFGQRWWEMFSRISNDPKYEKRKIRGRLFKNWWFAEKYYSIQIEKLKKESK